MTTPVRTAFDLATRSGTRLPATLECGFDPLTDAVVAGDALARRAGFTAADLAAYADRHPGARGVRAVARVAALLDPRADSPPGTRMRVKLVLAGLPRPAVRLELRDRRGQLCFELDLAWREYRPLWVPRRVGEALLDRGWVPEPGTEWARIMINRAG